MAIAISLKREIIFNIMDVFSRVSRIIPLLQACRVDFNIEKITWDSQVEKHFGYLG